MVGKSSKRESAHEQAISTVKYAIVTGRLGIGIGNRDQATC